MLYAPKQIPRYQTYNDYNMHCVYSTPCPEKEAAILLPVTLPNAKMNFQNSLKQ